MTNPQDPYAAPGDEPSGQTPPPPPPGYGPPPGEQPPAYGQQPYGQPPPYGQQQPYGAPVQAGYNTLAIVGFVMSFLCSPAGIILGLIARNQIKQSGERGDGLAIAAIAIGSVLLVLGVLIQLG